MTIASIKTNESRERGKTSHFVPSFPTASGQQGLTHVVALVEATRKRRLAALRISELTRQAVETLVHQAGIATYSEKE